MEKSAKNIRIKNALKQHVWKMVLGIGAFILAYYSGKAALAIVGGVGIFSFVEAMIKSIRNQGEE